ncbi:MAG: helix-turn-helix domain-containing protein [Gammaproteobacteria bacterium]|nr:helix-turn-helix domain-containing protein [Gammaproteobacteria bacterium]
MNVTTMQPENNIQTAVNIGLNLRKVIADHSQGLMTHREYQILEFIVGEHLAQRQMVMEQGMSLRHLGSRYTLHKAIKRLISQGFVTIQQSPDSRLRPLVPTQQTLQLFANISDRIRCLVNNSVAETSVS